MTKVKGIGVICEDTTDFKAIKCLIKRITGVNNLRVKAKVGNGSGKLKSKCLAWSNELMTKGCNTLIVVHDLDSNNLSLLKDELEARLKSSSIKNRYLCIPVQELEAWFLGDPEGIKHAFGLSRLPKVRGLPESINSPKEYLGNQIYLCSEKEIIYFTAKNETLAECINIDLLNSKSPSFFGFFRFISAQKYT